MKSVKQSSCTNKLKIFSVVESSATFASNISNASNNFPINFEGLLCSSNDLMKYCPPSFGISKSNNGWESFFIDDWYFV